jgi:hypothetical protein
MIHPQTEPTFPIPAVYLIDGNGHSPGGPVEKLQAVLEQHWPGLNFIYPDIPFRDSRSPAEVALGELLRRPIPEGSLLVGQGLGGLVAAKLQELVHHDLQIIAISSPTWADEVTLERRAERRIAFYSSQDPIIRARVANWPQLTSFSQDLNWLDQNTDPHLKYIARIFDWYVEGTLTEWIHKIRESAATKQERDEIVWNSMAQLCVKTGDWDVHRRQAGRPRNFTEVGTAIRAGRSWNLAWGDWLHDFVYRKDARSLAAERHHGFQRTTAQ